MRRAGIYLLSVIQIRENDIWIFRLCNDNNHEQQYTQRPNHSSCIHRRLFFLLLFFHSFPFSHHRPDPPPPPPIAGSEEGRRRACGAASPPVMPMLEEEDPGVWRCGAFCRGIYRCRASSGIGSHCSSYSSRASIRARLGINTLIGVSYPCACS